MWKDPLAGEPFKLTVGSPAGAAPEHKHKVLKGLTGCWRRKVVAIFTKSHTGSAGVTASGFDILKLLNQGAEKLAGLQFVLV